MPVDDKQADTVPDQPEDTLPEDSEPEAEAEKQDYTHIEWAGYI